MAVAISAPSMMEARFGSNAMRHFWSQSSDGVDLDHAVLASLQNDQKRRNIINLRSQKTGLAEAPAQGGAEPPQPTTARRPADRRDRAGGNAPMRQQETFPPTRVMLTL
jgi:hypothetical protein